MSNDNLFENVNWDKFLNPLKKYTFLGIAMLGMILSLQMGASPFQVVLGIGALGLYTAFPNEINKWYESNQGILIGGALGFFWAPPFGLPLGALLGHFLHDKYIKILNTANQVKEAVRPIVAPGNWLKEKAVDPVLSSGLWLKDKAGGLLNGAVNGISNALSDMSDVFESAGNPLYESQEEPAVQEAIRPAPVVPEARLLPPPAAPILAATLAAPVAEENPALAANESPSSFDNLVNSGRNLANKSLTFLNTASNIKERATPLYQQVTSALHNVGNLIPESPVSTKEVISAGKSMINNSLSYLKSWWPSHNDGEGEEEALRANAPVYFASQRPGAMQEGPAPERMQTRSAARSAREDSSSSDEPRRSSRSRKKRQVFTII